MTFRFIHTADWQIGKAFSQFDPAVGAQLRAARLEAIDRIAGIAREQGVAHVVAAGDVFDSELIEDHGLRQTLARMAAYPLVQWHLLPGNHDPARSGGVWERLTALGVPGNVHLLVAATPHDIESNVVVLPAPLAAKQVATDPTEWMDNAASPEGTIRIGVAHGSVQGFGSLGEASVPIDATRRISARLDYLALGDWHGTKEITAGVWYSGAPESDSFLDNGAGNVLLVSLEGPNAPPRVETVVSGHYQWIDRRVVLSRPEDLEPIESELMRLGADTRRTLLRLGLEGAIGAADAARLDQRLAKLSAHPLAIRVDSRRLATLANSGDREQLGDASLATVAERLAAMTGASEPAEARAAARALRLLFSFAADLPRREGAP